MKQTNSLQTFPVSRDVVEAALEQLERKHRDLIEQIDRLGALMRRGPERLRLHHHDGQEAPKPKRRKMSAAARKRIADAQRKRWAAYRKQNRKG